ncbi:splicing factor 3A subunit 2-like [Triticum urartu]|uniref:splicing factor 3A subunit 2-like n=1 Tax=Triticum urartu TaxID=4572 RepID=UPI00204371D6|nr:splicing factor 3A subunit 2-like [Triticum urartu]
MKTSKPYPAHARSSARRPPCLLPLLAGAPPLPTPIHLHPPPAPHLPSPSGFFPCRYRTGRSAVDPPRRRSGLAPPLPCIAAGLASATGSLHRRRPRLAPPLPCIAPDVAGAPRIAFVDFGCVRYHCSTLPGVAATVSGHCRWWQHAVWLDMGCSCL